MRFIHTADWHLGNTMHDIDRTRETESFLEWLKTEIATVGAEALVIAGDVFDVVNPSNIAKKQYYRFLASLLQTKCSNVVVIGGNHDSGSLLDAPAEILEALNIKVVGSINNRCIDDLVVELKNGDARRLAFAVPCRLCGTWSWSSSISYVTKRASFARGLRTDLMLPLETAFRTKIC